MIRTSVILCLCFPLIAAAQPVVPGFDRFPRDTPAQQIAAGEVLINELNCVACHTVDTLFPYTTLFRYRKSVV